MAVRVVLALILVMGLMFLASWLRKATPAQRSVALRNILIYGVAGILILLVVTGRIPWLFALVGAALPWIQRGMMALRTINMFRSALGSTFGGASQQQSRVNTAWLAMTLDHSSGDINGEVLQGPSSGKCLNQMTLPELLDLLQQVRNNDGQSIPLLEAYLDRYHADWRGHDNDADAGPPPSADGPMTRDEALSILGLEEGASQKDITDAHRRLMLKMHPDRGGSAWLAARINQARDQLLD